jgi:hypothetical protein
VRLPFFLLSGQTTVLVWSPDAVSKTPLSDHHFGRSFIHHGRRRHRGASDTYNQEALFKQFGNYMDHSIATRRSNISGRQAGAGPSCTPVTQPVEHNSTHHWDTSGSLTGSPSADSTHTQLSTSEKIARRRSIYLDKQLSRQSIMSSANNSWYFLPLHAVCRPVPTTFRVAHDPKTSTSLPWLNIDAPRRRNSWLDPTIKLSWLKLVHKRKQVIVSHSWAEKNTNAAANLCRVTTTHNTCNIISSKLMLSQLPAADHRRPGCSSLQKDESLLLSCFPDNGHFKIAMSEHRVATRLHSRLTQPSLADSPSTRLLARSSKSQDEYSHIQAQILCLYFEHSSRF